MTGTRSKQLRMQTLVVLLTQLCSLSQLAHRSVRARAVSSPNRSKAGLDIALSKSDWKGKSSTLSESFETYSCNPFLNSATSCEYLPSSQRPETFIIHNPENRPETPKIWCSSLRRPAPGLRCDIRTSLRSTPQNADTLEIECCVLRKHTARTSRKTEAGTSRTRCPRTGSQNLWKPLRS